MSSQPHIAPARFPGDLESVRTLFLEYARAIGVDLCFQHFDEELADLPGKYAPPSGQLLLAGVPGDFAGCVALRPFDETTSEIKRLYVRPAYRGTGLGRCLIAEILGSATSIGYRRIVLDTLDSMHEARALYRSFGFEEIEPYYANPIPDARYFAKRL